MALSGEQIRHDLAAFARRWSVYEGSERAEAQTFLNELFACYGQERRSVATFEEPQPGGIVDLIWPSVCLFEMKAPGEARRLDRHREQALRYWQHAADHDRDVPAPRYVVICAFRRLEVWEPGAFPGRPRAELDLIELPDRYDVLLFLTGGQAVFRGPQEAVTRGAVANVTELYRRLRDRLPERQDELRDFVLQAVWCMFAEDLGQIPGHRFTGIVESLLGHPERSSADELGRLFWWLANPASSRPAEGLYAGTPFANGSLFEDPATVHLEREELELLRAACEFHWREVEPQIFGSLLEGGLGHDKQWALGAHYTHEADIQKVIQPTVVDPWRERIENIATHAEAVAAQNHLADYVVLDPACGSGNFLYVAYRELRRLEKRLGEREAELRRRVGLREQQTLRLYFPLHNLKGIDIDGFAVALARVTLWMGHKLAVDELDLSESTLPLVRLSGVQSGDALRMQWPRADAIVGNPPFHGSQRLRAELGDDYVEWLRRSFGVGVKDYCVYWFRRAHDHLAPEGRAGLVGTNSISQNRARGASLEYVVENGGLITDAVSTQDWPGEAAVDVSIVNWVKEPNELPPQRFLLDGSEVAGISTSLRPASDDGAAARRLPANRGRSFQGAIPAGNFYLSISEAEQLLAWTDASYRDIVRPYLVGDDIADDPGQRPRRYVIDFGSRTLEEAMAYPAALDLVRGRVKPERDRNRDPGFRAKWWLFGRPRGEMRRALAPLTRYVATNRVGKRVLFCWCDPWTCPSDLTNVFAFDDDYSMAILTSRIHTDWARSQSSTLEDRIRYTPTSAFETFPWPTPTAAQREAIADLSRRLIERRQGICAERQIGLTALYNQVEDGAWADLRELHRRLDQAVAVAYGWPASAAHDPADSNARLLTLNGSIAADDNEYAPLVERRRRGANPPCGSRQSLPRAG